MKFILGKKLGMTQVFKEDGEVVPVTRIQAGPCQITQIKKGSSPAVQIGFTEVREKLLTKSQRGHLKDLNKVKFLRDFQVEAKDQENLERGQVITVETFVPGDKVAVSGISKGKGFQGVVKRHGFHGSPASHGHKDQLRMPGSIGATGPQRVFKGTRMAGRMGGDQITVKNLEIVEVHPENNELYVKGAVPGAKNGLLLILADGDLQIKQEVKAEEKEEQTVAPQAEQVEEKVVEQADAPAVVEADKEESAPQKVEDAKIEEETQAKEEVKTEESAPETAEAANQEEKK